jgi:hypothetical protein
MKNLLKILVIFSIIALSQSCIEKDSTKEEIQRLDTLDFTNIKDPSIIGTDSTTLIDSTQIYKLLNYSIDKSYNIILTNSDSINIHNKKIKIEDNTIELEKNEITKEVSNKIKYLGRTFSLFQTELPIIEINTTQDIPDDPKVKASFKLINNGKTEIESIIGIEKRGGYSQSFPKKSYSVEFWEDNKGDQKKKISVLGMRNDDDWIMDGLWNEPLRIRDFTSHQLWLEIARINNPNKDTKLGIDRRYCELFLNGHYRGVYYIGEKIDRKQLDVKKYKGELNGEIYKGTYWAPGVLFEGLQNYNNNSGRWSGYEAKYPDEKGELNWGNLHSLVDFVVNSSNSYFNQEVFKKFDKKNIVDYFLFFNAIYAIDNRGKNLYTAKIDKEEPYFFVAWDMDACFGREWRGLKENIVDSVMTNGLYDRLLNNDEFKNELKQRWTELRSNEFNTNTLIKKLTDNYQYLKGNGVYTRERIIPKLEFKYSESEIDFIKDWVTRRMTYFTQYIDNL